MNEEAYLKLMNSEISSLRGVGAKRAEAFSRIGVYTVGDLLRHFPRSYQNRGNVRLISDGIVGENCSYMLTVGTQPKSATLKNRKVITKFRAFDESGTVEITYFNSRYIENSFRVGETHRFWGKINKVGSRYTMSAPIHEFCLYEDELPDFTPIYPSGAGLTQGFIKECISAALVKLAECGVPEVMPQSYMISLGLPISGAAYRMIHMPKKLEDIELSRRYFTARELYLFSLALSSSKSKKREENGPLMTVSDVSPFIKELGFPLTGAQERSVNEIVSDMIGSSTPMSRLLSGDVGSGKTAVAAAAIYVALKNGYQAALMAPTEILASQHAETLSPMLEKMGYNVGLILGSTSASAKKVLRARAANGELDLLIGTHSLLTEDTVFDRLGLVITDEQHRFGVNQRAGLGKKNKAGHEPHVLVMSATPIPRTLALILYGELSLSMLDELPPGRQKVDTFVVDDSYRSRLNAFIEKQVKDGGQVYIVCPTVEPKTDDEDGDLLLFAPDGSAEFTFENKPLKSATEHCAELKKEFPELKIGLIHGRMKGKEKDEAMRLFAEGSTDVLVSTTVIEVGVNVPNASLMIIENADRFGLAQLHQLRGRVGRGSRKAYCVLVSDSNGENAKKRLNVMKTTYDGYKIAEYDLGLRGPGDYFPSGEGRARQHGSFNCIMNADMEMLKQAMSIADTVVASDPELNIGVNRFARLEMNSLLHTDGRAMQ